jgi:hypothetical protein
VPDGVTELVTHPGLDDVALHARYPRWRYAWDEETRALCDERVRNAVASLALTRPSDVPAHR